MALTGNHPNIIKACYTTGTLISHADGNIGTLVGAIIPFFVTLTGCYSSCTVIDQNTPPAKFHTLVGPDTTGIDFITYEGCYYLTTETGQTGPAKVTYQKDITPEMIEAMNAALGADSEFAFNGDGTLRQKQQQ